MKIAVLSDLHGILPRADSGIWEDDAEVLILCGDLLPQVIDQNIPYSLLWFETTFMEWRKTLPFKKVIFIAGNHDSCCEVHRERMEKLFSSYSDTTYLHNTGIEYISEDSGKTYRIFGTPYCKIFGTWAFMREESELEKYYSEIPEALDILITHDAPYGVSDEVHIGPYYMKHAGSNILKKAIIEKRPRYVFHGHLHTSNHEREILGASEVYNTSLVNDSIEPIYKPLYLFL